MSEKKGSFFGNIELSALWTVIGITLLFSTAIFVTLLAPDRIDPTWTEPTSSYQVQMYEVSDPNVYISSLMKGDSELQSIYHLKRDFSLLAFKEGKNLRIIAPEELKKYITGPDEKTLKLTSRLMMLRKPEGKKEEVDALRTQLQSDWEKDNPDREEKKLRKPAFQILELYEVDGEQGFAVASVEGILEDWVDRDFTILDETPKQKFHRDAGVIYVNNPKEYRITRFKFGDEEKWKFDPEGEQIASLDELRAPPLGFRSRKELIEYGEHIFAIEGCWYCHTDQTRTLVQDVVLNGSDSYPAPPSSANEYIYQRISFPGTRRIGPDVSRVGIKRPSRDWHMSHFWSPKTASRGSVMPAFQHFFDYDPRGTTKSEVGIPNHKFEAIFQYMMTKGTRITPPTEAWWIGKDPIQTKEVIEGRRVLP